MSPTDSKDATGKIWRKPLTKGKKPSALNEIHVIVDRCKGCGFCIEFCPRQVLGWSEEYNAKGYHPPKVLDIKACVNCKLCEMLCPEFAIFTSEPEDAGDSE